ncbi:hypothetical protein QVD17_30918 [Tagetes erecta]|uniref:Uncharacterized protein n=1 Tax=Tagetes erecta TaxID=13708 RepID=A0AAD8K575_TARER|nr:hypothetical protein QVD17_30918 [Tagetes erecta]
MNRIVSFFVVVSTDLKSHTKSLLSFKVQQKIPKDGTKRVPNVDHHQTKFQKGIQKIPKGNDRKEKFPKMELKRSPKVDQIRIEPRFHTVYDCAISAVEKVNRREK